MTIREAIKFYSEAKAKYLNMEILDVINNTCLCLILEMNNGVEIFIDSNPEADYFKKDHPLEMPNKNGIFKRLSFEILNSKEPIISESIKKYLTKSNANGVLYFSDTVKEKVVNEFINDNGGINKKEFIKNVKETW